MSRQFINDIKNKSMQEILEKYQLKQLFSGGSDDYKFIAAVYCTRDNRFIVDADKLVQMGNGMFSYENERSTFQSEKSLDEYLSFHRFKRL